MLAKVKRTRRRASAITNRDKIVPVAEELLAIPRSTRCQSFHHGQEFTNAGVRSKRIGDSVRLQIEQHVELPFLTENSGQPKVSGFRIGHVWWNGLQHFPWP